MIKKYIFLFTLSTIFYLGAIAQQSVARQWNEAILQAVREDFARPPITARTMFHTSMAMYEAWAVYDTVAETYFLGKTVDGVFYPFNGVSAPADIRAAREEAISYAAYRIAYQRYLYSPGAFLSLTRFITLMNNLGYDINNTDTDYSSGSPAALGNYIAQQILNMGYTDGSNELSYYGIQNYYPINQPLTPTLPGNPNMFNYNNWQPLNITGAVDQNGNPIPAVQVFQMPEWGRVRPFAMDENDRVVYNRNGFDYLVYHDPGPQPKLNIDDPNDPESKAFKIANEMVAAWSSHHDPNDGVMWDISPATKGNIQSYPQTLAEQSDFYNFLEGGDTETGYSINPKTGQPYPPNIIPRADYTRVLSQFWADGPNSETPPGHWFAIWNHVNDQPELERRFGGVGPLLDTLEWEVKSYFTLGGGVHDAAISAWGIKGWYDSGRPITGLRFMAGLGQSTDPALPHYHPGGVELIPGYVELVLEGDTLAGANNENVGKIKFYSWKGYGAINDPTTDIGGVGWMLAENWMPYQRPTFVTPPFAGYISGHSTFSRAAAEVLTALTGDPFFPGGVGEFHIAANSNFFVFEAGPSVDVTLQWATYRDASDQTSLSRIWGGIHPGYDDIPGRLIGMEVGMDAFNLARTYFYPDKDGDGFLSYEDCDDNDAEVYPGAIEQCDGRDNDCNGIIDDNAPTFAFYRDADSDGYGDGALRLDTCLLQPPGGYVANALDCDDNNNLINPGIAEICDGIDNDCNGIADDNITLYAYYADNDNDGFGNALSRLDTCLLSAPVGFTTDTLDCDDLRSDVYPGAPELCDETDNDCNGVIDDGLPVFVYYADTDNDGFGSLAARLETCLDIVPPGFVTDSTDCDDTNALVFPNAFEIIDGVDNNCNGIIDEVSGLGDLLLGAVRVYPNPVSSLLYIDHKDIALNGIRLYDVTGKLMTNIANRAAPGITSIPTDQLPSGMYFIEIQGANTGQRRQYRILKQ